MSEQSNYRSLAAIMFADMVGYTRLMQEDESKAKLLRDRQRNVVDKTIATHNGRVMQYYGDGTLSMFTSAIKAVEAAREIQEQLQKDPKVPLRIGIHIGDVVHDSEGVFGDAVNVAARVQSLSVPGGVMISGKVFEEIKNHPGIKVEAFGEHDLKNVFNPISIFALANDGLSVPEQSYIQGITGSHKNSVAVLPFANFSPNPENEYFSDGITEEIINALVKLDGLQVPSRTSVFAYKNTKKDIREIGKELNVATVLEGSVRQAGNKIRVTAQLINTDDGFHVWSENYDGEMKDIFKVQDEISQKIAEKLEQNFEFNSARNLYEASTDSVVAYNHYLQGLYYWNKRTPESVQKAIDCYRKAIKKCATYTKAYSGLANCYSFLGTIGHLKGKEAFPKAEKFALKALELNDFRGESFVSLGFVDLFYKWDYDSAEANFRKAITLEPNNEEARIALAMYYRITGDLERMYHHTKAASKIAPVSLPVLLQHGYSYWLSGKHEKAIETYEKILELDPLFRSALEGMALVYVAEKKYNKAIKVVKKYLDLVDSEYKGGTQLGYIAALKGNKKLANENLEIIKKRGLANPDLNLSLDFAVIYAAMGENDEAFTYLNKAVDEKLGSILFIKTMFPLDKLKSDVRYNQLLEKMGLNV
ncbi:MAG: tetratricopeptide repeat protein [Balneola sp.]|nr:tetratricopeptide repeat protein [Balneola sp.]MBO6652071.1 tetratricopeptide repeat protein [Balneola sp.]MBO6712476.1 tetratricopeptide repeat protein [Balneola sp.]MBO6801031.1 tetratricopeptide repeat protein [Balneola sp.]MBO6870703.1 tetratricopeptide repeat protein [Balneola sp.]